MIPMVSAFAEWRKPGGGIDARDRRRIDAEDGGLTPWNLIEGTWDDIRAAGRHRRRQNRT